MFQLTKPFGCVAESSFDFMPRDCGLDSCCSAVNIIVVLVFISYMIGASLGVVISIVKFDRTVCRLRHARVVSAARNAVSIQLLLPAVGSRAVSEVCMQYEVCIRQVNVQLLLYHYFTVRAMAVEFPNQ